jgi:hypothetical protein
MDKPFGVFLAGTYVLLAMFAMSFAMKGRDGKVPIRHPALLIVLSIVLWLLAIQKASGLLGGATDMVRQAARVEGWYDQRRDLQTVVVIAIPQVGLIGLIWLLWFVRREWRTYLPVVIALTYLVSFAALQAVSLHAVDYYLNRRFGGIRLAMWGEVLGLVLVVVALVWLMLEVRLERVESYGLSPREPRV